MSLGNFSMNTPIEGPVDCVKNSRKRTYDASTTSTVLTSPEDPFKSSTNQINPLQPKIVDN
jgi:hypothetical protein